MAETLKITVILPCFNHAQFLEERIQSILSQTHPVDQIVFLDDASTDCSVDIAKSLLKNFTGQVDIRLRSANSGSPFAQWNLGVSLAKYDLIWIAETDDVCNPNFIDRLYSEVVDTGSVLAFSQSRLINESGSCLGSARAYTDRFWEGSFRDSFVMDGSDFNRLYMTAINAIPNASAVLFRKDAYESAGRANDSMRYCGDWDTWIRICQQGSLAFISDELNSFRCHPSTSRSCGHTPNVAAEYFACRVRACIAASTLGLVSISARDVITGLFDTHSHYPWSQIIRSGNLRMFRDVERRYQELPYYPIISGSSWIFLRFLCAYFCVKNWLLWFFNRLVRVPSAVLRRLTWRH